MATLLAKEQELAPSVTLTIAQDALADLGLMAAPPVGTRYKVKGEAEVTSVDGGAAVLSFKELYLMHEIEAEDVAARMYPGMPG